MAKRYNPRTIFLVARAEKLETRRCNLIAEQLRERSNLLLDFRRPGFQKKLHRRAQAGDRIVGVSARLEFLAAGCIADFALSDEVRRLHVPAADRRRAQQLVPALFHKQDSGARWTEHPLLR